MHGRPAPDIPAHLQRPAAAIRPAILSTLALGLGLLAGGCASPGPPRPPSLNLPQPVANLTASRQGDAVDLRFTLPQRSTDNLPLRQPSLTATVCRGPEPATCLPLPGFTARQLPLRAASSAPILWHDTLPAALTTGDPRPLVYRIELRNTAGRTAGWSAPAYTAAGAAPPPVTGLAAQGTPQGILLRWQPAPTDNAGSPPSLPADVLLRRDLASPPPAPPARHTPQPHAAQPQPTLWLNAHSDAETLDTSAPQDTPLRYTAVRRLTFHTEGRTLELRSTDSTPVEITLRDVFPPPVPSDLSAAPFTEAGRFAIDLVWNPVEDPALAGYILTRQPVDAAGTPLAAPTRLTPAPLTLPAFHDTTAVPAARYRYSLSAIDQKGNQSAPATLLVEPTVVP